MPVDLFVAGTGSLGRSICHTLAVSPGAPITVAVGGRREDTVNELVAVSRGRCAATGGSARFEGRLIPWHSDEEIAALLAELSPRLMVVVCSLQSPWEFETPDNDWSRLVHDGGFGVTVPFQLDLVQRLSRAAAAAGLTCPIVNGCYPDAVNPMLRLSGDTPLCGVGNVATLEAAVRAARADANRVQIVGHHYHLHAVCQPREERLAEPEVWIDGERVPPDGLFGIIGAIHGEQRNAVTGATAANLIRRVLAGDSWYACVPAPLGLPGGYPVALDGAEVALSLPPEMDAVTAIEVNRRASELEGVLVGDTGGVTFTGRACEQLRRYAGSLADGFRIEDYKTVLKEFLALRERLRGRR